MHTQHLQKLSVWAGIFEVRIIVPFFIPQKLKGETYLELLKETIDPAITHVIENNNNNNECMEGQVMY